MGAHAHHGGLGQVGKIGMVAEALASVDVGQVHLDEGDGHRSQGVAHGDAGMRVGSGVDDDERGPVGTGGLDAVDQRAFVVALEMVEGSPMPAGQVGQPGIDVGQRGVAVDLGLTGAQQVQVGAMNDQEAIFVARYVQDRGRSTQFAGF